MLRVQDERIPLSEDALGVLRVADTRVSLDAVVDLYDEGASAEEIAEQFDILALADVHLVLGYLLRHERDVRQHLEREDAESAGRRAALEEEFGNALLRERLRAKRSAARGK